MLTSGSVQITVFPSDGGWKFCVGDAANRTEPIFSEAYADERAAREEAVAHLRGEPSRHEPLSVHFAERRRERWEALILERGRTIVEMTAYLAANPELGLTALRKPEAKIASFLKQLDWQPGEYLRAGVSSELLVVAERQKQTLAALAADVAARIEARVQERPPRAAPVSPSQLAPAQSEKVDTLIRLFNDAPPMDEAERQRRHRAMSNAALLKMSNEGVSFGEASGGPSFLNQDEATLRQFIKETGKNLDWQCDTVTEAFQRYAATGEIPAPHYPMRIAVLLRKARDHDRETRFLTAWCRHFPQGKGRKYEALIMRARDTSATATSRISDVR